MSSERPHTPIRAIRVSDDLWERAQERASERDETVSEAIRQFLDWYAK